MSRFIRLSLTVFCMECTAVWRDQSNLGGTNSQVVCTKMNFTPKPNQPHHIMYMKIPTPDYVCCVREERARILVRPYVWCACGVGLVCECVDVGVGCSPAGLSLCGCKRQRAMRSVRIDAYVKAVQAVIAVPCAHKGMISRRGGLHLSCPRYDVAARWL